MALSYIILLQLQLQQKNDENPKIKSVKLIIGLDQSATEKRASWESSAMHKI